MHLVTINDNPTSPRALILHNLYNNNIQKYTLCGYCTANNSKLTKLLPLQRIV